MLGAYYGYTRVKRMNSMPTSVDASIHWFAQWMLSPSRLLSPSKFCLLMLAFKSSGSGFLDPNIKKNTIIPISNHERKFTGSCAGAYYKDSNPYPGVDEKPCP